MASFTKEVNSRLAKRPLVFNGRLADRGLISLVKEATGADIKQIMTYTDFVSDLCCHMASLGHNE